METLIVYPETQEQLNAIKAFVAAMNISFDERSDADAYPEHVIEGVKLAIRDADAGYLTPYRSAKDMLESV